mgnify:CR=1 FL=1
MSEKELGFEERVDKTVGSLVEAGFVELIDDKIRITSEGCYVYGILCACAENVLLETLLATTKAISYLLEYGDITFPFGEKCNQGECGITREQGGCVVCLVEYFKTTKGE